MRAPLAKRIVAFGCLGWVWAAYAFDHRSYAFSLLWPGLSLAHFGLPLAVIPFIGLVIVALVVAWRRYPGQPWGRVICEPLAAAMVYSIGAHLFLVRLPAPIPAQTPFDQEPGDGERYRTGFAEGYRDALTGTLRTYCFRPEPETTGAEDGAYHGSRAWYRFWGLRFRETWVAAHSRHEQASPRIGLYWEHTPPPKLDRPDAMAAVTAFLATNGWHMQTNADLWFRRQERAKSISGLPWPDIQTNSYEATTRDGILYVRLHIWDGETSGVAYNPQTNRFPPSVVGFKPLGGHWYTWLEVMRLRTYPQSYEGETPLPDWQEFYGLKPRAHSIR